MGKEIACSATPFPWCHAVAVATAASSSPGVYCSMLAPQQRDVLGLGWLLQPRWGAVVAFVVALAASVLGLVQHLPPVPILVGAGVTLASNFLIPGLAQRIGMRPLALGLLLFDTVLLTAVLFATGGAANPLTALYLIPVSMAALMLSPRAAWVLALAAIGAFGLLFFAPGGAQLHAGHHDSLAAVTQPSAAHPQRPPHHHHHGHAQHDDSPQSGQVPGTPLAGSGTFDLHLQGMWAAFTLTTLLVTYFVTRVATALRSREQQLARVRDRALRAEKVASLASLAASTAHELGTPFASIALAASEMRGAIGRGEDAKGLAADVELVREQIKRCRDILDAMLNQAGEMVGEAPSETAAQRLVDGAIDGLAESDRTRVQAHVPTALAPLRVPPRLVVQALQNLLRNGLDASSTEHPVTLEVAQTPHATRFVVRDRGVGMDAEALAQATEPFLSSNTGRGRGLGLFLTRSVAERLGGELTLESSPGAGTTAVFEVPTTTLPEPGPASVDDPGSTLAMGPQ